MVLVVALVVALAFVDGGPAVTTTVTGLSPDALSTVVFVVPVLFLGAFGAGLNLYRRFGGTVVFERGTVLPELPSGVVMRPLVRSRILWGAAAAFVVYVFTLLSFGGESNPLSLVLVAIAAGSSEQLLDRVLERQQARIAGLTEESTDTSKSTPGSGSTGGTNGAARSTSTAPDARPTGAVETNPTPTEGSGTDSTPTETTRVDDTAN
jgi:hypothetical protein